MRLWLGATFTTLTALAALVGLSAGCGSSGSNSQGGEAGTDDATSGCNDNGVVHASGTTWECSCNTCSCENGMLSTTLILCEAADAGGGAPGTDATDMDETQPAEGGPSSDGSASASCPPSQSQAECPVAPGALCAVNDDPFSGCALNALPTGLGCSGQEQCSIAILPCAGEVQGWAGAGRVDGYICSCVSGRWSCDDCYLGEALCADAGSAGDSAAGGGVDGGSATVIRLGSNDECLPDTLPTSSSGMTTCAIVITGLTDGCSATGLSPATPQEIAAIGQKGPYAAGSACELNQLAPSAAAPGCSDPQSTGWCYAHGSCLGDAGPACQQDICTTAAFNGGYFPAAWDSGTVSISWGAYLVCP
ncbi:MAG: hypothetical protein ACLP1X_16315 [Polyangiaceae bacterium]